MTDNTTLDLLASLVVVSADEFNRTFLRAQRYRDSKIDLPIIASLNQELPPIAACLRYARDHSFLERLLRKTIDDQVAGPVVSDRGRSFAQLCEKLVGITVAFDVSDAKRAVLDLHSDLVVATKSKPGGTRYLPERRNPLGYDTQPDFLAAQLQSTMRIVCRIEDPARSTTASGILIAPHLVATAAHVVESYLDCTTHQAKTDVEMNLRVRLDVMTVAGTANERYVSLAPDWLAAVSCCAMRPDGEGRIHLADNDDLSDSHDVAILRLATAPGLWRGWANVSRADEPLSQERRGLILHHHPMGASQAVSYGSHLGIRGARFMHNCSSLPGSSGGPLIDHEARLIGLHHGRIEPSDDVRNLAGGGGFLASWWRSNPHEHMPSDKLNPLWETLRSGRVGSGTPVLGFERLQARIWEVQQVPRANAAVVIMSSAAGAVAGEVIATLLPPDRATILQLPRAELDRLCAKAADSGTPVTAALTALADQLGLPAAAAGDRKDLAEFSTDAVRASQAAQTVSERLHLHHGCGPVWLVVQLGDAQLTGLASEALGHLYRALIGLRQGRGRLLVIASNPAAESAVAEMLRDVHPLGVDSWHFAEPQVGDLQRYLQRWFVEAGADVKALLGGYLSLAGLFISCARQEAGNGGDFYASLCRVLRDNLTSLGSH